MLARLDALPGVVGSRVDCSGRTFLVQVESDVEARILDILGDGAEREEVTGLDREELWFSHADLPKLSYMEARILARTTASRANLPPPQERILERAIRRELFRIFDDIHAQGGSTDPLWYVSPFDQAYSRALLDLPPEHRASLNGGFFRDT